MLRSTLLLVILSVLLVHLSACEEDDPTTAEILVEVGGEPTAGISVHMFDDETGPTSSFFSPFFAQRVVVTDADGVARFDLREVFDLAVLDDQTTLYFGVFDASEAVLGQTGLTISEGETKSATISY